MISRGSSRSVPARLLPTKIAPVSEDPGGNAINVTNPFFHGRIIWRHALFNAIGPVFNIVALNLAYLLSGVVVVETIFAFPHGF